MQCQSSIRNYRSPWRSQAELVGMKGIGELNPQSMVGGEWPQLPEVIWALYEESRGGRV